MDQSQGENGLAPSFLFSLWSVYLTKKTSIDVGDPQLPEVWQLTDHHVWEFLHKLHLLWGFKAPRWRKEKLIIH